VDGAIDTQVLAATRRSLHALAEHVLAAALHRSTGRIGLRAGPGGFATPHFEGPGGLQRLAVEGIELAVERRDRTERHPLMTLRAAAEAAGVTPGAPVDVYPPATSLDLDRPLDVDPSAAAALAAMFTTTDSALRRLARLPSEEPAAEVQLWPEHFDVATTVAEVNYGGSPGDDDHPLPYLYVGPWSPPAPDGDYWNEAFGASTAFDASAGDDGALAFFLEGRARLADRP
jgi:hypothetical protein